MLQCTALVKRMPSLSVTSTRRGMGSPVALFRGDVLGALVLEAVEALQRHAGPKPAVLAAEAVEVETLHNQG